MTLKKSFKIDDFVFYFKRFFYVNHTDAAHVCDSNTRCRVSYIRENALLVVHSRNAFRFDSIFPR